METLEQVKFGRRDTDKIVGQLLQKLAISFNPVIRPILTESIIKTRRPRRTKKQLHDAILRALQAVRRANPSWTAQRVKRRANTLVKLYKVV